MVKVKPITEVETLIFHNILAIVLLVLMVMLYDILARYMFRVPIGVGTSLSILLFLLLVSSAMVLLTRVYVRERIITCRNANSLVGGVTALLYISIYSALTYQSPYAMAAAVLMGIVLGFGVYMTTLVDASICQKIPSISISLIDPQLEFNKVILVRNRVTVGSGRDSDVILPVKAADLFITIINNKGKVTVTGKGLMIEDKGKLRSIDSVEIGVGESYIIWINNVKVKLTRLS
ncbi:hypothetical protein [Caldivirga maquilingensis]|uniref:Uncharacterized protein n=1 Tax=Caldivirga maquilingensis (strain ATCC 700844 / DSM 13496 / JCM 10307 / IC-167) TaxID=397948 RepID=A8MDV1_CALMQ|nr:hypothetical protein [Caldivirga maquilingensis]ABW01957.1 hypothetical protein Cmaq_1129 [Caldivirga maquilingensis IC-167]